jgi:uncharacterized repeat protein (TIGR03803 family)
MREITFLIILLLAQAVKAQTISVLHTFSGGPDGGNSYAGLTIRAGNLLGTTWAGGDGYGTVFQLKHSGSNWIATPLYTFKGNGANDGAGPTARVIFGPDGALYGTTGQGGGSSCRAQGSYDGCGTVFRLSPPPSACKSALCPWTETILYRFTGGSDGGYPGLGDLTFDPQGNLYGTTYGGGTAMGGTIYELTPSHGNWTEKVLYNFIDRDDGYAPMSGVIFDQAGNLYGTAGYTVYQLRPVGSGWVENTLYQFTTSSIDGGVIFDHSGNLFGGTTVDLLLPGGTVYELSPSLSGWTQQTLYSFPFGQNGGFGPAASLVMDAAGNLYGTTISDPGDGCSGGYGCGTVFQLSPNPDGTWSNTFLHEFTGGSDGANPYSNVVIDANGNMYGTASAGGGAGHGGGYGVVWEITP